MKYGLWHLFGPLSWPVWAWVLALLARWRDRRRLSDRLWFGGGLTCLLMTASPLGHILIRPLEDSYAPPARLETVDGIIVLSGAERIQLSEEHRQPILSEAGERLILASMLQHRFPNAQVVAIGGLRESGALRDIDIDGDILRGTGVPASRITLVGNTTDTCGNAQAARPIMKNQKHWLLVTSAAHMRRSMACFKAAGLEPIAYPVDFRGRSNLWQPLFTPGTISNLSAFDLATHEWIGLLWYRISGRIRAVLR